jgi:hypothetical protein
MGLFGHVLYYSFDGGPGPDEILVRVWRWPQLQGLLRYRFQLVASFLLWSGVMAAVGLAENDSSAFPFGVLMGVLTVVWQILFWILRRDELGKHGWRS